jgi:hypothetical protein
LFLASHQDLKNYQTSIHHKFEFGHCQAVRMFGCCIHEVKIAGKTAEKEHPEEETTYKDVPFHP